MASRTATFRGLEHPVAGRSALAELVPFRDGLFIGRRTEATMHHEQQRELVGRIRVALVGTLAKLPPMLSATSGSILRAISTASSTLPGGGSAALASVPSVASATTISPLTHR
jgi:hypothetical protein